MNIIRTVFIRGAYLCKRFAIRPYNFRMLHLLALLPERASKVALDVDTVFWVVFWLSAIAFVGVVLTMLVFMFKYRAREGDEEPGEYITHNNAVEITWTVIPAVGLFAIFFLSLHAYRRLKYPESVALTVNITGRQWGWKAEYPDGKKLITGTIKKEGPITPKDFSPILYVPAGEPVEVVLTSQDVIHSFYVPEFRVKYDAVPGRYTKLWFQALKPGKYPVLCTEYCGMWHSRMPALIVALKPDEWERFKSIDASTFNSTFASMPVDSFLAVLRLPDEEFAKVVGAQKKAMASMPLHKRGELLYQQLCSSCHTTDGSRLVGPSFKGLYGKMEKLKDGSTVKVDENYIRESILDPTAKIVAGYPPAMPPFQGQLSEDEIQALIAFIKTLK